MLHFSEGTLRRINGSWQAIVKVCHVGPDGRLERDWATKTSMTGIPAEGDGSKQAARRFLVSWRDDLIRKDATDEAMRASREGLEATIKKALGVDDDKLDMRFEDYAREFVRLRRRGASGGGYTGDGEDVLRLWVTPYLPDRDVSMRDLTADMIHDALDGLAESGKSQTTVRKAFGLIKSVTTYASNAHGLRPNPIIGVQPPSKPRPKQNHLEVAAADRLAETLSGMPATDVVTAARLALACGICLEEVSALQILKANPESMDGIHVNAAFKRVKGEGYVFSVTKNRHRDRIIPMTDELRGILENRIRYLRRECELSGSPYDERLFFTGRADGSWLVPPNLSRKWRTLSETLGLVGVQGQRLGFHDLRHTFATRFLAMGGSISDLVAILGHSTAYMALEVYAGSDPKARAAALARTQRSRA